MPRNQQSQSSAVLSKCLAWIMPDEQSPAEIAREAHYLTSGHDAASAHMYMTAPRPQTPVDVQRANEIVKQLRSGIEKYQRLSRAL